TKPNQQMSWKKRHPLLLLLMAAATLGSAAFGRDTVPKEEPDRVIRYGTLVIGDQTKRPLNGSEGDLEAKLRAGAAAGAERPQADQPEAAVADRLAELRLQRLRPSVRCDNDSMTLRIVGRRAPDFLVERGEESPVPLSEMPDHCGISVKRARRDVVLVAKYDGCHITQQGDSYVLPLRLWGAPVKMSCHAATPLKVSCTPSAMVIQLGVSPDDLKLKVKGAWQPLVQACSTCGFTLEAVASGWIITAPYTSSCFQIEGAKRQLSVLYMYGELTLCCTVTQSPGITPSPAEPPPVSPAPQAPIDHPFPYGYVAPGFWPFHYGLPMAPPKSPTVAPKSTGPISAASSASTKASADQQLWYPYPYGYVNPWPFYHSPSGHHPRSPTVAPTTTAPTTTTSTSTTSTSTKASADEQAWYPYPYPYGYPMPRPWSFYPGHPGFPPKSPLVAPKTTGSPTTATTPTKASADHLWYPYPYGHAWPGSWPYYSGYPGAPAKSPTVAPPTITPTTTVKPPSSAQQPSYDFPWLPVVYDPLVPMHPQGLPVPGPASGVKQIYQKPIFHPRSLSGNAQKGSLPQDAASVSAPSSKTEADQPVHPPQKWYYPMHQVPYASQQTARHEQQGVPQPYSWPMYYGPLAHSPSKQSPRDLGMYPFMPKPAYDQVFASRGWKYGPYPAPLSPLQVKAGLTNKDSATSAATETVTPTES
ncbi:hypothetical protein NFI96_033013, partial [Prochilodus magdalenae]